MARTPVGSRVGAFESMTENEVRLFGYGVYDGDFEPPAGPRNPYTQNDMDALRELGAPFTTPRITLDSGAVVWGLECWWGPEEQVRAKIGNRAVVEVQPPV